MAQVTLTASSRSSDRKVTKAALLTENAALKDRIGLLQRELDEARKTTVSVPSAATKRQPGTGSISADNPLFAGLPRYTPHTKITCPTHREAQANKAGFCSACALARIRGERVAA